MKGFKGQFKGSQGGNTTFRLRMPKGKEKEKEKEEAEAEAEAENTCSICLEQMAVHEDQITTNKCHHSFHISCLTSWLFAPPGAIGEASCPNCRSPLSSDELLPTEDLDVTLSKRCSKSNKLGLVIDRIDAWPNQENKSSKWITWIDELVEPILTQQPKNIFCGDQIIAINGVAIEK
jgi:hypothetical protein